MKISGTTAGGEAARAGAAGQAVDAREEVPDCGADPRVRFLKSS